MVMKLGLWLNGSMFWAIIRYFVPRPVIGSPFSLFSWSLNHFTFQSSTALLLIPLFRWLYVAYDWIHLIYLCKRLSSSSILACFLLEPAIGVTGLRSCGNVVGVELVSLDGRDHVFRQPLLGRLGRLLDRFRHGDLYLPPCLLSTITFSTTA